MRKTILAYKGDVVGVKLFIKTALMEELVEKQFKQTQSLREFLDQHQGDNMTINGVEERDEAIEIGGRDTYFDERG